MDHKKIFNVDQADCRICAFRILLYVLLEMHVLHESDEEHILPKKQSNQIPRRGVKKNFETQECRSVPRQVCEQVQRGMQCHQVPTDVTNINNMKQIRQIVII